MMQSWRWLGTTCTKSGKDDQVRYLHLDHPVDATERAVRANALEPVVVLHPAVGLAVRDLARAGIRIEVVLREPGGAGAHELRCRCAHSAATSHAPGRRRSRSSATSSTLRPRRRPRHPGSAARSRRRRPLRAARRSRSVGARACARAVPCRRRRGRSAPRRGTRADGSRRAGDRVGFARLLEAVTLRVELHAVVAAADAVVLDAAEVQARAAVRTPFEHDARPSVAVAEHDQVLAEESGAMRAIARQRARDRDRMPVAAHRFAHRRAGARIGEPRVVGRGGSAVARTGVDGCGRSGHRIPLSSEPVTRLCITVRDVCTPEVSYISFEALSQAAAAGTSAGAPVASPTPPAPRPASPPLGSRRARGPARTRRASPAGSSTTAVSPNVRISDSIARMLVAGGRRSASARNWCASWMKPTGPCTAVELGMQQRGEIVAGLRGHRIEPRTLGFFDCRHLLPPALSRSQSGSMPSPGRSGACTLPSPSIAIGSASP